MDGALEALRKEFLGLRTGRASASLLEPVVVLAYGTEMPIAQLGTVNVPEARLITVQVWDKGNVKAVESAIRSAGLGLNPMSDGQLIRIPIPQLDAERRAELTKVAGRYGEQARVAVRNVRRDGMEHLKRMVRDSELSEDEHELWSEEIQSMTDSHIKKIDESVAHKQAEISQV
ncbi:MAG: ribosome recycling factor [Alphaproteobacteria bacterium]|nr:ribosome recycling factor [Alphaproteobacteria bacterium]